MERALAEGGGTLQVFVIKSSRTCPKGESIRDSSEGKLPSSDGFSRWQR